EGAGVGNDTDPSRADAEGGVGIVDTLLALLDDPNGDGSTADSFITDHLLPMFGVPQRLADVRTFLNDFGDAVSDNLVGPLRLALNPLTQPLDKLKEIPRQFVKD